MDRDALSITESEKMINRARPDSFNIESSRSMEGRTAGEYALHSLSLLVKYCGEPPLVPPKSP